MTDSTNKPKTIGRGLLLGRQEAKRKAELEEHLRNMRSPALYGTRNSTDDEQKLHDAIREIAIPALDELQREREAKRSRPITLSAPIVRMEDTLPLRSASTPAIAAPFEQSRPTSDRESILKRIKDAPDGFAFKYRDAACACDVCEKTIRNWIDEGVLNRGAKRGTVTAHSLKQKLVLS